MRNYWYPLVFSRDLRVGEVHAAHLLGDPLVLFRDAQGAVACLSDRCPHRSAPLSLGRVNGGEIECPYHGWRFAADGKCAAVPSNYRDAALPQRSDVPRYPVLERGGLIWVWPGEPKLADSLEPSHQPEVDSDAWRFADGYVDLDVPDQLAMENALDNAHIPFTHHGTIGNRKRAQPLELRFSDYDQGLRGSFHRVENPDFTPLQYTFQRPCLTRFDGEVRKGWNVIQLIYWVPLTPSKTRFLYRVARNWLRYMPFLTGITSRQARKVTEQDLAMLVGQAERIRAGGESFGTAVQADGLATRYRRWRATVEGPDTWFSGFAAARVASDPLTVLQSPRRAADAGR